jgi:putative peptide zinc metalloprotease protein
VIVLGFHELGHAHACKHYGGRVPAMGFALIYLTPAFYTDTTEGHVMANRYQRLVISVAGVWAELMICAVATPVWWGTPPGTVVHSVAYVLVLITGISSALINWNPLMKLDGYHMLCEIVGIVDLKEASTAYVSCWVKRHVWRLPVEVPYVPRRRRLGFTIYALLSGIYSYTVLYIVARFVGNVFRNFNPEWSFLPELLTAALIFKSRIRTLVNFMKFVYLDKKDRVRAWFTPGRSVAASAVGVILLCLPLGRESTSGRFLVEPANRAVIRAAAPGVVEAVFSSEGSFVAVGMPLLRLRNVVLESRLALSESNREIAVQRAKAAALHYRDVGATLKQRDLFEAQTQQLTAEAAVLRVTSPISGVMLTPRLEDQVGTYVTEGRELAEIADLSVMRARIFVSEYDVSKCRVDAPARVEVDGAIRKWDAQITAISPDSSELDPGLPERAQYKGLTPPNFYVVDLKIANGDGQLKSGMSGMARVYGRRQSAAGYLWTQVSHFFGRKLW